MDSESFVGNRYWVLRHGKSIPNERGLIVSSSFFSSNGFYRLILCEIVGKWSSSRVPISSWWYRSGFLKVFFFPKPQNSLKNSRIKENDIELDKVRICYSPFSRTTHTAKVVAQVLNLPFDAPQCKMIEALRERYFGPTFELQSHDKYQEIWDLDENDPFMRPLGGESVDDVVSRLSTAIQSIEAEFQRCAILVVAHGDPLQMLQTIFHSAKQQRGGDGLAQRIQMTRVASVLSQHRKFALLTGELRPLL